MDSRSLAVAVVGFFCAVLVGEQPHSGRVTFTTFNTGLTRAVGPGGPGVLEKRRVAIGAALRGLGADVICLQEVWRDGDHRKLSHELSDVYPYSYRPPSDPGAAPGAVCPLLRGWSVLDCVRKCRRGGVSARACVSKGGSCSELFSTLGARCRLCLAANTDNPIACAVGGGRSFVYRGSTGLALFSRRPLEDARFHSFRSTFIRRGTITARVAGRRILCTHLSSGLSVLSYPPDGPHGSWQGEHRAQVDALVKLAEGCTILLGDLNAGQAVGSLSAKRPQTIEQLNRHGFSASWTHPRCTWCRDNPLATGTPDRWIDHVMVKDCPAATRRYRRVLDAPGSALSDHYGLLMVEEP